MPVIGLTTYQGKNDQGLPTSALLRAYCDAIVASGGVPLLIPVSLLRQDGGLKRLVERLDGFLFTGGGDIHPSRYGAADHPRVAGIDIERDDLESCLLEAVMEQEKPFFGICRGMQLINVILGGDLYADILEQAPGAMKHDYFPDWPRTHLAHEVILEPSCRLLEIVGEQILQVNSLHHQGVRNLATVLRAMAYSKDGIVESVCLLDYPFGLAVQWHPEWLMDQLVTQRLFSSFVYACVRSSEKNNA